jgi:hypothetical protein
MKNKNYFIKNLLLTVLILWFVPCCTEDPVDMVPDVPVNITLDLIHYNLPPAGSLIVTNQMVSVLSLGYDNNGIIVYHDVSEFLAYDRTCPFHVEKSIAVNLTDNPLLAECPECHSQYQLPGSGFPLKQGPSKYPLKKYHTTYYPNSNVLYIYN